VFRAGEINLEKNEIVPIRGKNRVSHNEMEKESLNSTEKCVENSGG